MNEYKKLILIGYSVFLILFIGSIVLAPTFADKIPDVSKMNNDGSADDTQSEDDVSALNLFIHNELGSLFIYIGSIFFGIPAIVMLI